MSEYYDGEEVALLLAGLAHPDPMARAATLEMIIGQPSGHPKVQAAVARMLGDRTAVTILSLLTGELALLAAAALSAEREVAREPAPVSIRAFPPARCFDVAEWAAACASGRLAEIEITFDSARHPGDYAVDLPVSAALFAPVAPECSPEEAPTLVDSIRFGEPRARVIALRGIQDRPSRDPAVVRALEGLLDDRTVCVLTIPYRAGELRLAAAAALVAERDAAGKDEPVVLGGCRPVLGSDDLLRVAQLAGRPEPRGSLEDAYASLRDAGVLRLRDVTVRHPAFIGWITW